MFCIFVLKKYVVFWIYRFIGKCKRVQFWNYWFWCTLIWLQTDKFTLDQLQTYQTSVVERECIEGVINTDYVTKYTTLAFLRKIDDINMSDNRGGKKLAFINKVWVKKKPDTFKSWPLIKKSTFFVWSPWNLVKIMNSWDNHFHQLS